MHVGILLFPRNDSMWLLCLRAFFSSERYQSRASRKITSEKMIPGSNRRCSRTLPYCSSGVCQRHTSSSSHLHKVSGKYIESQWETRIPRENWSMGFISVLMIACNCVLLRMCLKEEGMSFSAWRDGTLYNAKTSMAESQWESEAHVLEKSL